jgi:lipid-A-disaccharide synthase
MATAPNPSIFLSAGEASGEHYGAALIASIRRLAPAATFFGLGGPRMEAAGLRRVVRAEDVAHMGITEILRHAPYIYAQYRKLKRALATETPDLAILIDFPDVNLRLAEELDRLNIPVVYFVSPQLWAWKKRRILTVQKFVTRMLVIFPFEEPFYRAQSVPADYVGHPLADLPLPTITRADFARQHGLDPSKPWIALLPGSRMKEVALNLLEMIATTQMLPGAYEYLLPVAPTLDPRRIQALLHPHNTTLRIHLVDDARAALYHAHASVVASGTATVEAALIGNPFVVVYRLSALSYAIARRVVDLPHVAMVNLIAGQRLVPELIQHDFTSANVVRALQPLLEDTPQRAHQIAGLARIRTLLHTPGAATATSPTLSASSPESAIRETAIDRVARISLSLIHALDSKPSPSAHPNATEPPQPLRTSS